MPNDDTYTISTHHTFSSRSWANYSRRLLAAIIVGNALASCVATEELIVSYWNHHLEPSDPRILRFDEQGTCTLLYTLNGIPNSNNDLLVEPAISPIDGALYIHKQSNDPQKGEILRITDDQQVEIFTDQVSTGARGIAFDDVGNLYVASGREVLRFDSYGNRTMLADGFGLTYDIVIGADDGLIYVSDYSDGDISVYDASGTLQRTLSDPLLRQPLMMVFDPQGRLLVTDWRNENQFGSYMGVILRIDLTTDTFETYATGIDFPAQMTFGFGGDLFVVQHGQPFQVLRYDYSDPANTRQVFAENLGRPHGMVFTSSFGGPPDSDGDGVPDDVDDCPTEDASNLDADSDGCIDTADGLIDLIKSLNLDPMPGNKLINKAQKALRELEDEDIEDAIEDLEDFIDTVERERDNGHLSVEDAQLLINYTENVIRQLEELV